jgi:hypothetical protein
LPDGNSNNSIKWRKNVEKQEIHLRDAKVMW